MSEALIFDHYPLAEDQAPPGWAITSVGHIARLVASGFPSGKHNHEGIGVPHIRPMNIDREGRLDLDSLKYVDGAIPRELSKSDVLFNNTNSPELIGKTTVVSVDRRLAYSNHMTRISLEDGFDPTFIARQLYFLWLSGYFRYRCANHVNQASIAATPLSSMVPIAVAPSSEQSRIGEALDELFSDLDVGAAALKKARDKLKLYRASVLKAAGEGALTANWRVRHPQVEPATELLKRILVERRRRWEEDQLRKFKDKGREPPTDWKAKYKAPLAPDITELPILPEGWCWANLGQLTWSSGYGTSVKCRTSNGGLAVLRIPNVVGGRLSIRNLKFAPVDYMEHNEDLVSVGDVLVVRTNGSRNLIGRGLVVKEKPPSPLSFASYLIRMRIVGEPVLLRWLSLLWDGFHVRSWIEGNAATSAGQYNINLRVLDKVAIPIPPFAELSVAVDVVESQFSGLERIEAELDAKLEMALSFRQSVLKQAFTGQLVPQDPNDEPASELLKRIATERDGRAREARTARRRRPSSRRRRR